MRKPCIATCALLLLLAAAASTLDVKSAAAIKVAVQWGHLAPSGYPAGEGDAQSWICNEIYWNFYNTGTWASSNAYGTYTQLGYVAQVLQYCQSPNNGVTWATTWWVGDFKPTGGNPQPFGYLGFYGHNGQDIFDYDVYKYANYYLWPPPNSWWQPIPSKQYFAFIWTCANGGLYWYTSNGDWYNVPGITSPAPSPTYPPPANPNTKYGFVVNPYSTPPTVVGMPLAWTGSSSLSIDGYNSPDYGSYCYVGWETISPWMVNPTGYDSTQFKWFPYYFYRCALGYYNSGTHQTIQYSLNFASQMTLGTPFYTSKLYNGEWRNSTGSGPGGWWYSRMRVFGNSNLILPY
ncbi:MAG: hypothetical protein WHU54_01570 [Candidatus Bathyarchaeia archaeon]